MYAIMRQLFTWEKKKLNIERRPVQEQASGSCVGHPLLLLLLGMV